MMTVKTLIIDNYDSFTYNLYQLVATVNGVEPVVIKNDEYSWHDFLDLEFDNIIISPGPGHPANEADFGICQRVLQHYQGPILGICLGHQGLCATYGAKVIAAPLPMHGRRSPIIHEQHDVDGSLFEKIPSGFNVVRYHSLMVKAESLPDCLQVIATTTDGIIMAVRHRDKPHYGVQFHPESILSDGGHQLLDNFRMITMRKKRHSPQKNNQNRHLKIYVDAIPVDEIRSQQIYQELYAKEACAVWLDSDSSTKENTDEETLENQARFSIMAAPSGPLSYHVSYNVAEKKLCQKKNGETQQLTMSIYDFLESELNYYQLETDSYPFPFKGGFIGYFGYELMAETINVKSKKESAYPDAQFLFVDRFIVLDHQQQKINVVCLDDEVLAEDNQNWMLDMGGKIRLVEDSFSTFQPENSLSQETKNKLQRFVDDPKSFLVEDENTYYSLIQACQEKINEGETYEVCLTNRIEVNCPDLNLLTYYHHLRQVSPAPYSSFLKFNELEVACASMERFLKVISDRLIETKPIKGTLPRGKNSHEDQKLITQLRQDEKFQSENLMIVDLLRNDLGKVCETGSVHVPNLMKVETYRNLHQLVTTIRGKIKPEYSTIDVLKATFPGGSITGAPKKRTCEIIECLETTPRGIYTGSIGYLSLDKTMDMNIVIRTATKNKHEFVVGVGGAIIAMSDPEEEFDEILLKAKSHIKTVKRMLGK